MTFLEACADAARMACRFSIVFYVYEYPTCWRVTPTWEQGWLFKAFPGGMKIMTLEGAARLTPEQLSSLDAMDADKP